MRCSALVFFAIVHATITAGECPKNVVCKSTLDPRSCPPGTFYRDNVKAAGCCPGCVKLKGLDQPCRVDRDCEPGLKCTEKCVRDPTQRCEDYKRNDETYLNTKYWEPNCLTNGKYGAKQCKGERLLGKCFCTNANGGRILGESAWSKAENLTCVCSRLVSELREVGEGVTLHCDENGNFEDLQCQDGVCWCSNERTGIPYTVVVPESMVRTLPCFYEKSFGCKYLRQCESIEYYAHRAIALFRDHGTNRVVVPIFDCNYDGSYARVQSKGLSRYCTYKNLFKLTDPQAGPTQCNCKYDWFVEKELESREFAFECHPNGDYLKDQVFGNEVIQVDLDGIPYSK